MDLLADRAEDLALQAGDDAGRSSSRSCGAVYAVAVKDPVYEAKSSYVLINPPAPPTAEEIARDPALGTCERRQPIYPLRRPVGDRPSADRAP